MRLLGTTRWPDGAQLERRLVRSLCAEQRVLSGPLRGLRYPSLSAAGSSLLPKLVGCYEFELHPAIEQLLANDLSAIVDVGCAEGYYAVGMALRCPRVPVYAFDTDERARELCSSMADHNGVAERVQVLGGCSVQELLSLPLGEHALLVVDCEGYESQLLTEASVRQLSRHSLVVECHDFLEPGTTSVLRSRFRDSHQLLEVRSLPDLRRAEVVSNLCLADLSAEERLIAVSENRPARMGWLVMLPHSS